MNKFNFTNTFTMNNNKNTIMKQKDFSDFCLSFYSKLAYGGYSECLDIFDKDARCMFNDNYYNNPHEFMFKILNLGVKRMEFINLQSNGMVCSDDKILMNTTCNIIPIDYENKKGEMIKASESIILVKKSEKYYINSYILRTYN